MLITMSPRCTEEDLEKVIILIDRHGLEPRVSRGVERTLIGAIGSSEKANAAREHITDSLPGIESVTSISKPYKLVCRDLHPEDTVVSVGGVKIGNGYCTVIAGPCAIESLEQALTIAKHVKLAGAHLFRGGAFKPRTSPYSFQGLEEEGLKIIAEVRERTGMGVVTEMTSVTQFDLMKKYVDVVQIGARNMQNFELLKCVGRIGLPVLLKRGLSATIEEWLMAAEYVMSEGNPDIILCERGIRTYERATRNTLDMSSILMVKQESHLPIIVDPSHATGRRDMVIPMSRAAVAAGAHGLMVEVHHEPDKALSDGPQSLYPEQFKDLMRQVAGIAEVTSAKLRHQELSCAVGAWAC